MTGGEHGKDGKPREMHVDKSIDVTKVDNRPELKSTKNTGEGEISLINSEYFKTDKITIKEEFKDESNLETFYIMNVISGSGKIICDSESSEINIGDSFIVPANLGKYDIIGNLEILKSYV